jgi:AcrR family transcriptional regulator
MVRQSASGDAHQPMTVTALCELAGVSRNALYRYHPDMLHELQAQRQGRRDPGPDQRALLRLRADNEAFKQQVAKLAALVDHYFAAWQQASTQLARRERELAQLRRNIPGKVVAIRRQMTRGSG